jgi:hypothetical protein
LALEVLCTRLRPGYVGPSVIPPAANRLLTDAPARKRKTNPGSLQPLYFHGLPRKQPAAHPARPPLAPIRPPIQPFRIFSP